jgi:hypothetical protein
VTVAGPSFKNGFKFWNLFWFWFQLASLWVIGLTLRESVRKRDMLQTHRTKRVAIFSNSQVAIWRMEHLEPG